MDDIKKGLSVHPAPGASTNLRLFSRKKEVL